ncbi:light-harvesting protein [Rhodocyclus gracilis]
MSETLPMENPRQHPADDFDDPLSGLSDDEARAFNSALLRGFRDFTLLALIAHALLWAWRPWLQ